MIQGRSALTEQCRTVLRFIDAEGVTTAKVIAAHLGQRSDTPRKHIKILIERGFIVRHGRLLRSLSAPGNVVTFGGAA
jgi:DNA-binding MarR family transcriptional regulator